MCLEGETARRADGLAKGSRFLNGRETLGFWSVKDAWARMENMRVGLFTDSYFPQINGVATSVGLLKQELERLGHEVFVFTTTDPEANRHEDVCQHIFRMYSLPVMADRRLGLWYSPRLMHFLSRLQLDLIHTHTEFSLGIFGRSVAKLLDIPLVHTYHTIYEDYAHYISRGERMNRLTQRWIRTATAMVCNHANELIVPTSKVERLLRNYGVYTPISVIPTGIDLSHFEANEEDLARSYKLRCQLGYRDDERVMVYVGRIAKEKRIDLILEGLAKARKNLPQLRLMIVGYGPESEALEQLAKELGLDQPARDGGQAWVYFAGPKPWAEIPDWYRVGDAFTTASRSETQGLTYIEALASGLPILVRSDAVLDDLLKEGQNGWSWDEVEDYEQALTAWSTAAEQKQNLAEQAKQSAAEYSLECFAQRIIALYERLMLQPGFKRRRPLLEWDATSMETALQRLSKPLLMPPWLNEGSPNHEQTPERQPVAEKEEPAELEQAYSTRQPAVWSSEKVAEQTEWYSVRALNLTMKRAYERWAESGKVVSPVTFFKMLREGFQGHEVEENALNWEEAEAQLPPESASPSPDQVGADQPAQDEALGDKEGAKDERA